MADDINTLEDLSAIATGAETVTETAIVREPVRDELGRSYFAVGVFPIKASA